MGETREQDVLNTWTDELNAALHPLGILVSGVDAAGILPVGAVTSPLEALRALTDADIISIAETANKEFATRQISAEDIRVAVARTRRHYA